MEINEALLKAAEEKSQGLAKHQPLESTEKTRTNTGSAMRMDSMAKLIERLPTDDHVHAAFKISTAWRIKDNPAKLKTAMRMWGHVGGALEDSEALANDLLAEYKKWSDHMVIRKMIDKRNIAIGICANGEMFTEVAWKYQITDKTAKQYAMDAIDEWVEVNKKPREKKIVPVERNKWTPQDRPTKIVIFED